MSIDSIGDFLTILRNGILVSKKQVSAPFSKIRFHIAEALLREGFIRDMKTVETDKGKSLVIHLKYVNGESVIHEITRISKPGRRRYEGVKELGSVIGGLGIAILTTNRGIVTDKEARNLSVGGEVLCYVW